MKKTLWSLVLLKLIKRAIGLEEEVFCRCPKDCPPCKFYEGEKFSVDKLLRIRREICEDAAVRIDTQVDVRNSTFCNIPLINERSYIKLGQAEISRIGRILCQHYLTLFCLEKAALNSMLDTEANNECTYSEWTEWSRCPIECFSSPSQYYQTYEQKRSRYVLTRGSFSCTDQEEKQPCNLIPSCPRWCWTSQWSNWSTCNRIVFFNGTSMDLTMRRKYIYYYSKYCNEEKLVDYKSCAKPFSVEEKKELEIIEDSIPNSIEQCTNLFESSGCSMPCQNNINESGKKFIIGINETKDILCVQQSSCNPTNKCPPAAPNVKCFVSESRRVGNRWVDEEKGSCICADLDSVPCNIHEALVSINHWSPTILKKCNLMTFHVSEGPDGGIIKSDSAQFISLSDNNRIHCPLRNTNFTYTQFESKETLLNFCHAGNVAWSYIYDNQTRQEIGKGLVLCKFRPIDCRYSEWSAWSPCSDVGGSWNRIRTRHIVFPQRNGGMKCSVSNTIEYKNCSETSLKLTQVNSYFNADERMENMDDKITLSIVGDINKGSKIYLYRESRNCEILKMESSYDFQGNEIQCSCPDSGEMCSRIDTLNNEGKWAMQMEKYCEENPFYNILLEDGYFSCSLKMHLDILKEHKSDMTYCNADGYGLYCIVATYKSKWPKDYIIGIFTSLSVVIILLFINI